MHVTETRKPCNHVLHLILTLLTCGMWAPVWLVLALTGRRERAFVYAPQPRDPATGYVFDPVSGRWVPPYVPLPATQTDFTVDPVTGRWVQRYAPPEGLPPEPSSRP